jgi:hypothetical protein
VENVFLVWFKIEFSLGLNGVNVLQEICT